MDNPCYNMVYQSDNNGFNEVDWRIIRCEKFTHDTNEHQQLANGFDYLYCNRVFNELHGIQLHSH